jgi:hypothetical protein
MTQLFRMQSGSTDGGPDSATLLCNCNGKLSQRMEFWENEMQRANGVRFHIELLNFFYMYARLFLNSFGLRISNSNVRFYLIFNRDQCVVLAFGHP